MARHRDIRNLDLDEVLREDEEVGYGEVPELTSEQEDDVLPSKKSVTVKPKKPSTEKKGASFSNSPISLASLAATSYYSNKVTSLEPLLQQGSETLVDKQSSLGFVKPSLASLVATNSNLPSGLSNLSTLSSGSKNLSCLANIPTSLSSIVNTSFSSPSAPAPAPTPTNSTQFSKVTLSMLANLASSSSLSLNSELPNLSQVSTNKLSIPTASNSLSVSSSKTKFGSQSDKASFLQEQRDVSKKEYQIPNHPLLASPSPLADFLFESDIPKPPPLLNSVDFDLFSMVLESVAQSSIKPSRFDQPSPDDVVKNAQKQAGKSKSKTGPVPSSVPSKPMDPMALDMAGLNLNTSVKAETTSTPKPVSSPKSPAVKRVDVLSEYKSRNADRTNLNLVVVGHVDAGKSTMMGHLLYQAGVVDSRTMKKYEKHSEKIGKKSFAFAWVLDETSEERERGITVDVATTQLTTERHIITILDAPGHRDFVPNMISGASQADVAILVVDSTPGEFETGFARGGQTKEHALLIRSLGVRQIAVAINKLDTCFWDYKRFESIQNELGDFLTQAGFPPSCVTFVPVSGLLGENLTLPISDSEHPIKLWYSGPSLLQVIDGFVPQQRAIELPLRLPIADFFRGGIGSTGGVSVSGRILQGHLQIGDQVAVQPGDAIGTVKAIEANDQTCNWAVAGDAVKITLSNLDVVELRPGSVLSAKDNLAPISNCFRAQVLIFDPQVPITPGYPVILHHQSLNISAYITKLVNLLDRVTGSVQKSNPRHLPKSCTATLEITADTLICLESFKSCKDLGRFALRREGSTLATGIILQVLPPTL